MPAFFYSDCLRRVVVGEVVVVVVTVDAHKLCQMTEHAFVFSYFIAVI